jgi:two-component system nitrate/nitrite sensor histidine kinase NarX
MFRCDAQGEHQVLVENDGIGFDTPEPGTHPGKHIGLTIMQERAAHIGGTLRIESDPEEGTRIELQFKYSSESRYNPLQHLAVISK